MKSKEEKYTVIKDSESRQYVWSATDTIIVRVDNLEKLMDYKYETLEKQINEKVAEIKSQMKNLQDQKFQWSIQWKNTLFGAILTGLATCILKFFNLI